jgi:hypothetical protein
VAFGFLLSPLFVVFMVWFVGWLVYCRLWPRRGVVPRAVSGDHLRRVETVCWVSGSPARKLVLLLPNKVVTTGMTDLASVYRAGAVDRAVDD